MNYRDRDFSGPSIVARRPGGPDGSHRIVLPVAGSRWKVRERVVERSRRAQLSVAEVDLPDGVHFEQWVLRFEPAAIVAVLNERDEVLMIRRHRFVIDRDVWELPGGYVVPGEDAAVTAAREVEEETGWRPGGLRHLFTFQPSVGTTDSPQQVFTALSATRTSNGTDINEAEEVAWVPLAQARGMITRGQIVGAASIIGIFGLAELRNQVPSTSAT